MQMAGDVEGCTGLAESLLAGSRGSDISPGKAGGGVLLGWALTQQGETDEGLGLLRQGIDVWRGGGSEVNVTHFLGLLAEANLVAKRPDEARESVENALALVQKTGERYWEAQLWRTRATVEEGLGLTTAARESAGRAVDLAFERGQPLAELRALLLLARLLEEPAEIQARRERLGTLAGMFAGREAFRSSDLDEAAAWLAAPVAEARRAGA
jgi:predicted ATPase